MKRKRAILRLRTKKLARPRVFYTGILPSTLYGSECAAPHDRHVQQLRHWGLQAHGLPTHGINKDAAYALLPLSADPLFQLSVSPFIR